jgi:hypothetical protein
MKRGNGRFADARVHGDHPVELDISAQPGAREFANAWRRRLLNTFRPLLPGTGSQAS